MQARLFVVGFGEGWVWPQWKGSIRWTGWRGWIVMQRAAARFTIYNWIQNGNADEFSLSCVSWGKMPSKVNQHDVHKDLVSWKSQYL